MNIYLKLKEIRYMKLFFFLIIIVTPLFSFCQTFESNLPIIVINTFGNEVLDDPRIIANMGIINNASTENNLNDLHNNYSGQISIELRGSSSQQLFPKKSYSFETQDFNGENNNVSILNLPEENDWVLYGAYSDKTFLRNSLTYHLSRQMGNYAPRTEFCELFLNNEYQGLYLLIEKIKRDKNRVDIEKNEKNDITGGYIIKIDKLTDSPINSTWCSEFTNFNNDHVCFQYHYPKADEITESQKLYIEDYMNNINSIIKEMSTNQTPIDSVENINFTSFLDYLIISELTKNVDAYRLSTFLYKDSDLNDGLLTMGPVWDYNLSLGNVDFCKSSEISEWVLEKETACRSSIPSYWYDLLQNDSFSIALSNRWFELRQDVLSFEEIFEFIDLNSIYIKAAQERNFELWDIINEYVWPNYQLGDSFESEVDYLKYWIYHRVKWIDDNINDLRLIFPDCNSSQKKLLKKVNQLGQVINNINNEIVFYIYDNGCVESKFIKD